MTTKNYKQIETAPKDELKRCDFFKRLTSFITKHCTVSNEIIILCGDFNCQLDRREVKSVKSLHNLLKHFDLYDVWKYEHPSTMATPGVMLMMNPKAVSIMSSSTKHFIM